MAYFIRCIIAFALCLAALPPTRADSYSDTLKAAGLESDLAGLAKYLKQFQPTPQEQKKIDALIKQFGDDDFNVRDAATVAMKKLAVLPRAALEAAMKSEDPEVKWRAEDVLKSGNEQEQVLLLAAMKVIDRQKHKGLLAEVIAVFPYLAGSEGRTAGRRAIAATATREDAAKLRALLKHDDAMLRAAGVYALSAALGKDAVADAKPLLADRDESVQLAAARALADVGDRGSLETYLKLLESRQFSIQYEAEASLRWLSGKTMKVAGEDEEKQRAMLVQAWRAWIGGEGKTAQLRFPLQLAERIDLFNGADLNGWQAVHGGQRVNGKEVWSVKDGVLQCTGKAFGYLRTKRSFLNYELSVDWRWPAGVTAGDSGVWLMLSGPDAELPKGLEANLGAGKAGDFWSLADFKCKVKGMPMVRNGPKFAENSEKPAGQWNTMTIRVHQGTVSVKVNGVEQNAATDCPKEPGCVALQTEGHPVDFRNITLLPLED